MHLQNTPGCEKRQSQRKNGAAVGIHPAGSFHHGLFRLQSQLTERLRPIGRDHPAPERAQRSNGLAHKGKVHVGMSPDSVRAHQAGLERSFQLKGKGPASQVCKQVRMRDGRCKERSLTEGAPVQGASHGRGAHNNIGPGKTRDNGNPHALPRKLFRHQVIVARRERIRRFGAHKTRPHLQGRRNVAGKQVQVQLHLRHRCVGEVFHKISRKSSR